MEGLPIDPAADPSALERRFPAAQRGVAEPSAAAAMEREALRIFRRCLDEAPAKQTEFLDRACAARPELRRRIDLLLAALPAAESFLEQPAIPSLAAREADDGLSLLGTRVGRYRVLRQIAAGGMGVVYLAEQESPRRTVALKVMRAGLASPKARRLFEHESQILGRLEHPNVARIYEAATHAHGPLAAPLPFFAMEYVDGAVPLTTFARQRNLGVEERIGLFRKACLGVHHGHQKGVIHRDLKPANIIVDGAGEPRVIDYGVALVTGGDLEATRAVSDAAHFVGTLRYMSPEQCRGDVRAIDTRSDVYALGVILYELLCDRFPLDLDHLSPMEVPRAVIESMPVRPRVAMPELPRDLEAIVLKAMAKAPEERYQSAADLERDLGRYLRSQPIEARRASSLQTMRLFMRRHRALIAAGAFAASAGLVALAVSIGFGITALRAERRASEERDLAVHRQYFADLAAAESALRANEFGRLRAHLADAPAIHRGWEWSYLHERSEPSMKVVERPVIVDAVAIDPQRSVLLGGGRDGMIGVWSLHGGEWMGEIAVRTKNILDLAMAPAGRFVAATTDRGAIELFDLERMQRTWSSADAHGTPDEPASARAVAFTADGTLVVSVGYDGTVRGWDSADGASRWVARLAPGRGRRLYAISCPPTSGPIATGGFDGAIDLWDARTGASLGTLEGHPEEQVTSLLHSSDGRLLYSGSTDRTIAIWDLERGSRIGTLVGHERSVWGMALSADGELLASVSIDHTLRLWSTADGEPRGVFHGHGDAVADVAFLPEGGWSPAAQHVPTECADRRLVTSSWDRTIRWWDLGRRDERLLPQSPRESIDRLAITADGRLLAASHADQPMALTGRVLLRDAETLELLGTIERSGNRPRPLTFSPDGRTLAIGWTDGLATIEDTRTGARLLAIDAQQGGVSSLEFSRDGAELFTGGRGPQVLRWDASTGAPLGALETELTSVNGLTISHDGSMLACTSHDGLGQLWDLHSMKPKAVLRGHLLGIYGSTFSPDDRHLLTGSRDQTIRVWECMSGRLERVLEGHGQWVTQLAFTPDRSRLVTSSWFETLTLWDGQRLESIVSLRGHRRPIRSMVITPTGDAILTGDDDGTMLVWDRRERSLREDALRRAAVEASEAANRVGALLERLSAEDAARVLEGDSTLAPAARRASLNELLSRGLHSAPQANPRQSRLVR